MFVCLQKNKKRVNSICAPNNTSNKTISIDNLRHCRCAIVMLEAEEDVTSMEKKHCKMKKVRTGHFYDVTSYASITTSEMLYI